VAAARGEVWISPPLFFCAPTSRNLMPFPGDQEKLRFPRTEIAGQ
jgi:hypothetical protein